MMRKKRFYTWLLCVATLISLLGALSLPAAATAPTVTVPPQIEYAADDNAFLKELEFSQTAAWNLTITSKKVVGSGLTYAVILREDLFNTHYAGDKIASLGAGNYNNLVSALSLNNTDRNYYRYQGSSGAVSGSQDSPGTATLINTSLYNFNSGNTGYQVGETSTTYHMKYVAILFDGATTLQNRSDYTIAEFYINSQGWLQTESYMLRYMSNNKSVSTSEGVSGVPAYQIEGWKTDAEVNTTATPSRKGYSFLGWDANKDLMSTDPNTAAGQTVSPQYPHKAGEKNLPWSTVSAAFGTEAFSKTSDKFYNLYAIWRPNKVEFSETNESTTTPVTAQITYNGTDMEVPMLNMAAPQVGMNYHAEGLLTSPTTDGGTDKTYAYLSATVKLEDGKTAQTVNIFGDASASDPAKKYNLKTAQGTKTSWVMTGKPDGHSKGQPVYVLLQVQDTSNKTTDMILLRFPEIKKGAQITPDLDVNTGLEGTMATLDGKTDETSLPKTVEDALIAELQAQKDAESGGTEEPSPTPDPSEGTETTDEGENNEQTPEVSPSPTPTPPPSTEKVTRNDLYGTDGYADGRIIGFYSAGQPQTVINGETATDKTGTYTAYYLKYGMLYEYRPYKISGQEVTYENDEAGWREVPFRKDKYTKADDLKLVEAAMGYKATTAAATKTSGSAVSSVATDTIPAWDATYGWIQWEGDLPVVHGLKTGDVYQVRFKANDNYAASATAAEVTIGGGTGGNSKGPGDFAAVVFYDWDETTVLGTLVVEKGADATKDVAAFAASLKSPESKDVDTSKETYFVDDAAKPLTYKRGYSFENVWLPFESETLTHYGSEVQGKMVEKPTDAAVDFSKVDGDLVVKACYGANSELNTEGAVASQRYSTEILSTERVAGDAFIVTIKAIRVNILDEKTVGVPRLGAPGLRVTMKTSTGLEIKSLISLENTDETTVQTLPTTKVSEYSFEVVDTYQDGNWPNAGIKSTTDGDEYGSVTNNLTSNSVWTGTSFAGNGYLYTGTLVYINNMVKPGGNPALISQPILDNMKLDYSMVSATLPIPAFRAMAAPPLIRKAFYALNDIADDNDVKDTYKPLTYKQIQYAIAHEGALLIE